MARSKNPESPTEAETEVAEALPAVGEEAPVLESVVVPDDVLVLDEPGTGEPEPSEDGPEAAPAEPRSEPAPAAPTEPRRGGFWPTALGGVVAAGIGAGAALFVFPEGWRAPVPAPGEMPITDRIAAVEAGMAEVKSESATVAPEIEALAADLAALKASSASAAFVTSGLRDLSKRVDALQESLQAGGVPAEGAVPGATPAEGVGALAAEVAALKANSASAAFVTSSVRDLSKRIEAVENELAELRASVAEGGAAASDIAAAAAEAQAKIAAAEAEATRLKAETEAAARQVAARAGLSHLQAAFASGAPMAGALDEIAAAGVTVPDDLRASADGVQSLRSLQESFPEAARAALTASLRVSAEGAGTMERLGAFLRSQTGARSLEPREGDDPDAVLSRAEAALGDGDLERTLAELEALPEEGRAAMEVWTGQAEARLAVAEAIAGLAVALD